MSVICDPPTLSYPWTEYLTSLQVDADEGVNEVEHPR